MKRILVGLSLAFSLVVPSTCLAHSPTRAHVIQYQRDYRTVQKKFGHRAPGCNLVKGYCHSPATDSKVVQSTLVLERMLAPPPVATSAASAAPVSGTYTAPATTTSTVSYGVSAQYSAPASGGYIGCIISAESGGNPQAVNGQYSGIGQWSQSRWVSDGGGKYASTPTGASYQQQYRVLSSEGSSGMHQQQGQYDRCG